MRSRPSMATLVILLSLVAGCWGGEGRSPSPTGESKKATPPPGSVMPPRNIATH